MMLNNSMLDMQKAQSFCVLGNIEKDADKKKKYYQDAIQCYNIVLDKEPNNIEANTRKANVLCTLGALAQDKEKKKQYYEDAIKCCNAILEQDPKHIDANIYKARSLKTLGVLEKDADKKKQYHQDVVKCCDAVLEQDPKHIDANTYKANVLCTSGALEKDADKKKQYYEDAIKCFDIVLKQDPNDIEANTRKAFSLNNLAALEQDKEKQKQYYEDAIKCFDIVLKQDPKHIDANTRKAFSLNNLAFLEQDKDKKKQYYEDAIQCYNIILDKEPNNIVINKYKAFSLKTLGALKKDADKQEKYYENATNANNNLSETQRTILVAKKQKHNKIDEDSVDKITETLRDTELYEKDVYQDFTDELSKNHTLNTLVTKLLYELKHNNFDTLSFEQQLEAWDQAPYQELRQNIIKISQRPPRNYSLISFGESKNERKLNSYFDYLGFMETYFSDTDPKTRFYDITEKDIEKKKGIIDNLNKYIRKEETKNREFYGSELSDDSDDELSEDTVSMNADDSEINKNISKANTSSYKQKLEKLINGELYKQILKDGNIRNNLLPRKEIRHSNITIKKSKEALKMLNELIKKGMSVEEANSEIIKKYRINFYIAQYRGIHYMTTHFGQSARRFHRDLDEIGKSQYSQSVLFGASQMNSINEIYKKQKDMDDAEKRNFSLNIEKWAYAVKHMMLKIGNNIPFGYNKEQKSFLYNNVGDFLQDIYSKSYNLFAEFLQNKDFLRSHLLNPYSPYVSTGDVPYHALKYAYGIKPYKGYEDNRLRPRWKNSGKAERPYSGKVYLSIHPLSDYGVEGPNRVNQINRSGRIKINQEILHELETSFLGYLPEDRVIYHYTAKYPSFSGTYKKIYYEKYGLNESIYNLFKQAFSKVKPHTPGMTNFKKILGEWLCAYHEVRLIEKARQSIEQKNGILIYRNEEGVFQFNAPSSNNLNKLNDNGESIRDIIEEQKILREKLCTDVPNFENDTICVSNQNRTEKSEDLYFQKFIECIRANKYSELKDMVKPEEFYHKRFVYDSDNNVQGTALHLAAFLGNVRMCTLLIKNNLDNRDSKGNTPFHIAIAINNADIIELLSEKGASTFIPNNDHTTPADLAQNIRKKRERDIKFFNALDKVEEKDSRFAKRNKLNLSNTMRI